MAVTYIGKVEWDDDGSTMWRPEYVRFGLWSEYDKVSIYIKDATAETNWQVEFTVSDSENNYYGFSLICEPIYNYDVSIWSTGYGNTITGTVTAVRKENLASQLGVRVVFEGDQYYLNQRPKEVDVSLLVNGNLIKTETFSKWNRFNLVFVPLEGFQHWEVKQNEIPYYTTTYHYDGANATIINTWAGRPEPNPQPGDHPNLEDDVDLMYCPLLDDFTAESVIDHIHILNYGDHNPNPTPIP